MARRTITPSSLAFISALLLTTSIDVTSSFCRRSIQPTRCDGDIDGKRRSAATRGAIPCTTAAATTAARTGLFSAMERLHDPSTNAYGIVEHIYSLREIGEVTDKIYDDEWTALGSVIAENMLETILDVGDVALSRRGWVERTTITNKIAEEISSAVENALDLVRSRTTIGDHDRGPHPIPGELLSPLNSILRRSLNFIVGGLDGTDMPFHYNGRDLSVLVLSSVTEAIESYFGIDNANAPFFDLINEMDLRVANRRRDLLVKHSRGYEGVRDVFDDIESSRVAWLRDVLGTRAARYYEFGDVTTRVGNGHSHERERTSRRRGMRFDILGGLFRDLEGTLIP